MTRRFQFSLGRLLSAMLLLALALGIFVRLDESGSEVTIILSLIACGGVAGTSFGTLIGHPWAVGAIGAALSLPVIIILGAF